MSINRDTVVQVESWNGDWFTLSGPDAGDEGYVLATGVVGLYDPPVKAVYEEPGNWPGARYLSHRILRRDITFGVWILDDDDENWLSKDSRWRKAWAYDKDNKIHITTPDSGLRTLSCRLLNAMDIDMTTDPSGYSVNLAKMTVVAADPFWYGDDQVFSATTVTDTTFDPNPLPWPWPQEDLPNEDLSITIGAVDGGVNPTDQPIYPKWTVPGSTIPPALPYIPGLPWLGAPNSEATTWTLPDYSFEDDGDAARRLRMPSLIGGLRTNEVQTFAIVGDAAPTGGTFTLTFDGETTAGIAYNASTAAVKSALEALSNITVNDVVVATGTQVNEVQSYTITGGPTGGYYTLTFNGQTTAHIVPWLGAGDIQLALGLLSNLSYFDISVAATEVANEVQVIQFTGEPSGGYFTITFNGQTTSHLAYNCSWLDVANAISALSNVGIFEVGVTQDSTPFAPFVLTFSGANVAGINQNPVTVDTTHLTGGSGLGATVTTRTEGNTTYTITFSGGQAGVNEPQLTATSGFTGGVSPGVTVNTVTQGVRPYIVTFQNVLTGVDVPQLVMDTSGLTGGSAVAGSVSTITPGYTAPAENALIDSDPRVEQVMSESGSALWARMNGVRFKHFIPPWTEDGVFHISVSGAVIGQMVTLRLPRPWSRPWGLE
jgi:hypothetical protein